MSVPTSDFDLARLVVMRLSWTRHVKIKKCPIQCTIELHDEGRSPSQVKCLILTFVRHARRTVLVAQLMAVPRIRNWTRTRILVIYLILASDGELPNGEILYMSYVFAFHFLPRDRVVVANVESSNICRSSNDDRPGESGVPSLTLQ
jgi:hypothetical protein